jgi:hypothetical protein
MKLREEMEARLKASAELGPANADNPPISGWRMDSEAFDPSLQAAVDQILSFTNVLVDMVLRLAEAVDELRDAPDV